MVYWLVVSTPLKNISQLGLFFPTEWKNRKMFQTTNQFINCGGIPPVDLILLVPKPMSNSQ